MTEDGIKKLMEQESVPTSAQPSSEELEHGTKCILEQNSRPLFEENSRPGSEQTPTLVSEHCSRLVLEQSSVLDQKGVNLIGSQLEGNSFLNILQLLVKIGMTSLHFDPAVLVLCWRTIGKLLISGSSVAPIVMANLVLPTAIIQHLVQELCITMTTVVKQCVVGDDVMFEKRLKCERFLTSLLLRLLGQYPEVVSGCVSEIQVLLLSSHKLVYSRTSDHVREHLLNNLVLMVRNCNIRSLYELWFFTGEFCNVS